MDDATAKRAVSTTPKGLREALCAAQSALHQRARQGVNVSSVPAWAAQLQVLILEIDEVRPVGPDGKHGELHTMSCGCEGHDGPWSLTFWPHTS